MVARPVAVVAYGGVALPNEGITCMRANEVAWISLQSYYFNSNLVVDWTNDAPNFRSKSCPISKEVPRVTELPLSFPDVEMYVIQPSNDCDLGLSDFYPKLIPKQVSLPSQARILHANVRFNAGFFVVQKCLCAATCATTSKLCAFFGIL